MNSMPKLFRASFIVFGLGLLFVLAVFYFFKPADAQTAVFYPTTCLGGWQNVDKATGEPDIVDGLAADYNDENSASVFNSVAEIFCGGFEGEIPADAFHERVILNFSWKLDEKEAEVEATNNDEEDLLSQEISDFSDTIIEVRYTLDGEEWKSLGYVEAINNEVNFELPIEEFGTLDDLKNVQIALRTLSTFDIPPKIYLDAMWLEVEYNQGLMPEEVIEEIPEIGEEVVAKIDARAEKIIFKRTPEGINILSPVAIEISATPEDLITEKSGVIGVPRQVMEVMNYWGIAVYTETENFVSECVATSLPLPIAVFDLEKGDYKTGISLGETKEECDAFNMAEYPIFEVFETANRSE